MSPPFLHKMAIHRKFLHFYNNNNKNNVNYICNLMCVIYVDMQWPYEIKISTLYNLSPIWKYILTTTTTTKTKNLNAQIDQVYLKRLGLLVKDNLKRCHTNWKCSKNMFVAVLWVILKLHVEHCKTWKQVNIWLVFGL